MQEIEAGKKKAGSKEAKKTEFNNQWVSTGMRYETDKKQDNRERRDGPGGEDFDIADQEDK